MKSEIEDISTTGPSSKMEFVVEHLDNSSSAVSDHSGSHDESTSMEKKGLSAVDSYGSSQDLTNLPLSEPPITNHRDSTTCENPLQLQPKLTPTCKMKLSKLWVNEL
jgi:TFIIF-interacting CTD phosphatase-like protein